jgi:hypothetical protein
MKFISLARPLTGTVTAHGALYIARHTLLTTMTVYSVALSRASNKGRSDEGNDQAEDERLKKYKIIHF